MDLLELRDDQEHAYERKADHLYHVQGSLHFVQVGDVLYVRLLFPVELTHPGVNQHTKKA